ncbi:helix-turn-helix domain-containing protein [Staphylococcus sp. KG4-3]|uniref:helix-turn-helix domain-containing protein n=1 Tax=Staphylococcus TaxID=1279 RepID=UPI001F53FC92|nr:MULTISPECIES: AraC family transcriptional regulator [Staphylococcus]MDW8543045.1 AraC family transcriptional regulator [Staphylococcus sp. KG4-1]MDW8562458.1 AraC family transcriptional regulator [Staphylococcus sp. KG4-3]
MIFLISTLSIRNQYTSELTRCINEIVILLPLNKPCKINLNGLTITVTDGIIVNNADLYQMLDVQELLELKIPLPLFIEKDINISKSYFDFNCIHFVEQFRNLVLEIIHRPIQDEFSMNVYISSIIEFLLREARVVLSSIYIPCLNTKHPLVARITKYIHDNICNTLNTKHLSQTFYISQSYISILFANNININFKYYTTSLRIALSLYDLIQNNKSIYEVAIKYQFLNVTTYSKHFKYYIQMPPKKYIYLFKKGYYKSPYKIISNDVPSKSYLDKVQPPTKDTNNSDYSLNLSKLSFNNFFKPMTILIQLDDIYALNHFYESHTMHNDTTTIFPKVNFCILDTHLRRLNTLSAQQIINRIKQLILKGHQLTIKITHLSLRQTQKFSVAKLLAELVNDLNQITLQFDFSYYTYNELLNFIEKVRLKYPLIKIGTTIDSIIKSKNTLSQILHNITSIKADFYYIDLDLNSFYRLMAHKVAQSQTDHNLKQVLLIFISQLGDEYAKKLIITHLTHNSLQDYYNTSSQQTHILLTRFLVELNQSICGFGYPYYTDDNDRIMLFNKYHCPMPIVHIYSFLKAFFKQQVALLPNAIICKTNWHYHILLFSNVEKSSFLVRINHHFIKSFPVFSRLLNKDHGMITNLLPSNIDQKIFGLSYIEQINSANYPLSKLSLHYFKEPLIYKLSQSSLQYIMIAMS